ncbi:MAG: DUF3416 domain-containing protein [Deltaproteobacteria bacterium]|nr:DUF3416 domain-containing protein [Deltaproteobacteria bacterium]
MKQPTRIYAIKNVVPEVEGGKVPVKRVVGDELVVSATVLRQGPVKVWLEYRRKGESEWQQLPMKPVGKCRYTGSFVLQEVGRYEYTLRTCTQDGLELAYDRILDVVVDRKRALFAAWYEIFVRSQGHYPNRSGTFTDVVARLDEIAAMGFDVLYLTPIHPIGKTNRKGRSNALRAQPSDPGSVYAIGDETGGHKAIHPDYGSLEDFHRLIEAARERGMEIALDIALNCSPDHPYVEAHPGWFHRDEQGRIRFAENPPKKYEDVYPYNFFPDDLEAMWGEMRSIFAYWIEQGVRIFRVDNPHTKPVEFWEWVIEDIQREYPDVIFLAEAFTVPHVMELLSRIGFTQSYTYFTWRNYKWEIIDYFSHLTQEEPKEYFRGNLFTNTPDILPRILQVGGRPAFKMRATLAGTLSSVFGIYNGFELCESRALPGKEEYADSEKYEYKVWDWDRPGNIKAYIAKLNMIRRENPALQTIQNLCFHETLDDNILCYSKSTAGFENRIIVVINLDPFHLHESMVRLDISKLGLEEGRTFRVRDLITGSHWSWKSSQNYVKLDPFFEPAHILRIED